MIASRDAVLQRIEQHGAGHGETLQPVLERLHLVDVAPRYHAFRQIGANAAVVHDGDVGAAGGALRIGDEPAESVFVAFLL